MSGGSFDYLCYADIGDTPDQLEHMLNELDNLGYASIAAGRTRLIIELLRLANREAETLRPVWKAVEWWRSSDWGEAEVKAAIFDLDHPGQEQT